jgi:hypothetical protein
MTREEKYYVRIQFKLKIHQSIGQAYEDLFVEVMQKHNRNFRPVKPRGSTGDHKNDGFDKHSGKYYQVYAPEDLAKKHKKYVTDKISNSFRELRTFWDSIGTVKEYYFVVNDRYAGIYAEIEQELANLQAESGITCEPFLAKDLEALFLSLNEDEIISILGNIVITPALIADVDYKALNEVIDHLLTIELNYSAATGIPNNPIFEEKIQFNQLSIQPATLLRTGSYQKHAIESYFKLNGSFLKEQLKAKFNTLYKNGVEAYTNQEQANDLVFFDILNLAYPDNRKSIVDAKIVLMAYYFEFCDIFEEPKRID